MTLRSRETVQQDLDLALARMTLWSAEYLRCKASKDGAGAVLSKQEMRDLNWEIETLAREWKVARPEEGI